MVCFQLSFLHDHCEINEKAEGYSDNESLCWNKENIMPSKRCKMLKPRTLRMSSIRSSGQKVSYVTIAKLKYVGYYSSSFTATDRYHEISNLGNCSNGIASGVFKKCFAVAKPSEYNFAHHLSLSQLWSNEFEAWGGGGLPLWKGRGCSSEILN